MRLNLLVLQRLLSAIRLFIEHWSITGRLTYLTRLKRALKTIDLAQMF